MTAHHHHRVTTWTPSKQEGVLISMSSGITIGAHLRGHLAGVGCRCCPDVQLNPDLDHDGIRRAHIYHDDWCPLLAKLERKDN